MLLCILSNSLPIFSHFHSNNNTQSKSCAPPGPEHYFNYAPPKVSFSDMLIGYSTLILVSVINIRETKLPQCELKVQGEA